MTTVSKKLKLFGISTNIGIINDEYKDRQRYFQQEINRTKRDASPFTGKS